MLTNLAFTAETDVKVKSSAGTWPVLDKFKYREGIIYENNWDILSPSEVSAVSDLYSWCI